MGSSSVRAPGKEYTGGTAPSGLLPALPPRVTDVESASGRLALPFTRLAHWTRLSRACGSPREHENRGGGGAGPGSGAPGPTPGGNLATLWTPAPADAAFSPVYRQGVRLTPAWARATTRLDSGVC